NSGRSAPSVPISGLLSNWSRLRRYRRRSRLRPATYANWRPSGEIATRPSTSPGNGSAAATRTRVTGPPCDVSDDALENQLKTPANTAATSAVPAVHNHGNAGLVVGGAAI